MNALLSVHWLLITAIWYFVNGLLHDIFVISGHKDGYSRELLRLLMDGHVLILSGILLFVCYLMLQHKIHYGAIIGGIITLAMIAYCLMIFPFLKSFGTLAISCVALIVCVRFYFILPQA